ncbi:chaplin [Actinoplanes rectilineatus]|uniref:chaplin n=1 Tax=Actinoplanes rectilineatus TaxID=113571 RepID=UPI0009FA8353|nr:chaplin [Actinoplanes rectilineatus]
MKKTWVRKTLSVGILAAGALLFGPAAAANATEGTGGSSYGNIGALNGNSVSIPVDMPVNVVGNSGALLGGKSVAGGSGSNQVKGQGKTAQQAAGTNLGLLNGNSISVPVTVPVNVCGNSDAVLGHSAAGASCSNSVGGVGGGNGYGSAAKDKKGRTLESTTRQGGGNPLATNIGHLNGNDVASTVISPANLCGNSLGMLGHAYSAGSCGNDVSGGKYTKPGNSHKVQPSHDWAHDLWHGGAGYVYGAAHNLAHGGVKTTSPAAGNLGVLNGNSINIPITVPVNHCGNSLGLAGAAYGSGSCGNNVGGGYQHKGGQKPMKPGYGGQGALNNTVDVLDNDYVVLDNQDSGALDNGAGGAIDAGGQGGHGGQGHGNKGGKGHGNGGYVSPDMYADQGGDADTGNGGRKTEATVNRLTGGLGTGSLGGLDLLDAVR